MALMQYFSGCWRRSVIGNSCRLDPREPVGFRLKSGLTFWGSGGHSRRYYPDGCDAVIFGMLKEECN